MGIDTFVLVFYICQANVYVLVADLTYAVRGKCFMNIYTHKQEYMKNIISFQYIYNGTSLYLLHARAGKHTAELAQKDFAFRKIKHFGFVLGGGGDIYRLHLVVEEIDADHEF